MAFSLGWRHTLILLDDGTCYACGTNGYGQLGEQPSRPFGKVKLTGLKDIVAVSCGGNHSIVLDRHGNVFAFGSGTQGQLGTGESPTQVTPQMVPYRSDTY